MYDMKIKWVNLERRKKTLQKKVEAHVGKKINTVADKVKNEVDDKTAVDTWKLLKNNRKWPLKKKGTLLSRIVGNETPYAVYVEYGRCFQGKSNKYWRTKKQGRMIYEGIGLRFYHRTAQKYKK